VIAEVRCIRAEAPSPGLLAIWFESFVPALLIGDLCRLAVESDGTSNARMTIWERPGDKLFACLIGPIFFPEIALNYVSFHTTNSAKPVDSFWKLVIRTAEFPNPPRIMQAVQRFLLKIARWHNRDSASRTVSARSGSVRIDVLRRGFPVRYESRVDCLPNARGKHAR